MLEELMRIAKEKNADLVFTNSVFARVGFPTPARGRPIKLREKIEEIAAKHGKSIERRGFDVLVKVRK